MFHKLKTMKWLESKRYASKNLFHVYEWVGQMGNVMKAHLQSTQDHLFLRKGVLLFVLAILFCGTRLLAQPNWPAIKANASFVVHDTSFAAPSLLPVNVGGWEDGLYVTRNGKRLFSTYLPVDVFSWLSDLAPCLDFTPYYRPPLLSTDTTTNPFGCANFLQSDIITASRADTADAFGQWVPSQLRTPVTFEGGACGVLRNDSIFDAFVFTRDVGAPNGMELMLMRDVSVNPPTTTSVQILSSPDQEDNPHIERLNDTTFVLFFDRARRIYYALSHTNGATWEAPVLVTQTLNDQAPYDVQPHLWHDGNDWWVFFCADNAQNKRCIYKSKQMVANDWNSWGPKELVLEADAQIPGGYGQVLGVGEPSLTQWGDLYFVVVYGNVLSADTTDVFDCDPWMLPRRVPVGLGVQSQARPSVVTRVFPNPATDRMAVELATGIDDVLEIVDAAGSMVFAQPMRGARMEVDVQAYKPGLHLLRFRNSSAPPTWFVVR